MKKPEDKNAFTPASYAGEKRGITRREFLKGTAGFVLLCGSGFTLNGLAEMMDPDTPPVGPRLREEVEIIRTAEGAAAMYGSETCFTVNEAGYRLLKLADGRHTLEEIIRMSGMQGCDEAIADFFLSLCLADYLTARLEVNKVAVVI